MILAPASAALSDAIDAAAAPARRRRADAGVTGPFLLGKRLCKVLFL